MRGFGVSLQQQMMIGSAIVALATATPAQAQTREFNVPAQPAARAIPAFARQAGIQIVARGNDVRNIRTNAVSGAFTVRDGLQRLLAGTGLVAGDPDSTGIVSVRLGGVPASGEIQAGGAAADSESAIDQAGIAEILVLGQRSLNADVRRTENDTQPYVVLDRSDIERSGSTTLEDFIRQRVTAQSAQTPNLQQVAGSDRGNLSEINLRSLGTDETLILVDGRRVAGVGIQGFVRQANINGIPLSAVERVEVLPSSASAIYGGGATGGVVNIILRRDYSGGEVRLSYGDILRGGASTGRLDANAGFHVDAGRVSVLLSGSIWQNSAVTLGDRDLRRRGLELIALNNPAAYFDRLPIGATPNIAAAAVFNPATGTLVRPNLVLDNGTALNSPITFAPSGYAGGASDQGAALVANAGRFNLDLPNSSAGLGFPIVRGTRGESFNISVRRQFGERVSLFAEFSHSRDKSSGVFPVGGQALTILASAPNNPFRQNIQVTSPYWPRDGRGEVELRSDRLVLGAIANLSPSWSAAVDASMDWNRQAQILAERVNSAAASAAARNGALDLTRDGPTPGFDLNSLFSPPLISDPTRNRGLAIAGRLSGNIMNLPAGPISLSSVAEFREFVLGPQRRITGTEILTYRERSQETVSGYAEIRLPLFSRQNRRPGLELLELQLVGRGERYKTVGSSYSIVNNGVVIQPDPGTRENEFSSFDYTIGLRYAPVPGLTFRASYATGFLPPSVDQLVPTGTFQLDFSFLTDPSRGGEPLGIVDYTVGGNPELRPERSTSWTVGVVFEPSFLDGLRLSADWTRITKRDNINSADAQIFGIARAESVPGAVIRAAPAPGDTFGVGRIIGFDARFINFASAEIEALDLAASYGWTINDLGRFTIDGRATRQIRLAEQLTPIDQPVDAVDYGQGLKWRGTASLNWENGPWSATVTGRYFSSYRIGAPTFFNASGALAQGNDGRVRAQAFVDFNARYRFALARHPRAPNAELALTVRNLFDALPAFTVDTVNLISGWGDPRGRDVLGSLRLSF